MWAFCPMLRYSMIVYIKGFSKIIVSLRPVCYHETVGKFTAD